MGITQQARAATFQCLDGPSLSCRAEPASPYIQLRVFGHKPPSSIPLEKHGRSLSSEVWVSCQFGSDIWSMGRLPVCLRPSEVWVGCQFVSDQVGGHHDPLLWGPSICPFQKLLCCEGLPSVHFRYPLLWGPSICPFQWFQTSMHLFLSHRKSSWINSFLSDFFALKKEREKRRDSNPRPLVR